MMMIKVTETLNALHCWPEAEGVREYLSYPHMHKFEVTVWAVVNHGDREIEFHDLKDELRNVLLARTSYSRIEGRTGQRPVYDLGRASCEDLGNWVLKNMPHVTKVQVMEDGECGAEIYRDDAKHTLVKRGVVHPRPPIVTICGSTRFKDAHMDAMKKLEDEGCASFMVGCFMHADNVPVDEKMKIAYDVLHKRKIEMSDWIYVLNVDGYIGSSTASEIRHAQKLGIGVKFLEPDNIPDEFK